MAFAHARVAVNQNQARLRVVAGQNAAKRGAFLFQIQHRLLKAEHVRRNRRGGGWGCRAAQPFAEAVRFFALVFAEFRADFFHKLRQRGHAAALIDMLNQQRDGLRWIAA